MAEADKFLARNFRLETVGVWAKETLHKRGVEITSNRIFLDPPVAPVVLETDPAAVGILTYFVNELKVAGRSAPYSMVTAVGPLSKKPEDAATARKDPLLALLPADLKDDEAVINSWLAEDLAAKVGDEIEMSYYVMGAGNRLETQSGRFRIRAVVPLEGPADDPGLMPAFPGMAEVQNCRDWRVGVPVDFKQIRPQDEAYWKDHRGTPKAFITLAAGQRMWANRFGDLTAIRLPARPMNGNIVGISDRLHPSDFGLYFQPVRERAMAAATQGIDFGWLFLGLSLFLVLAALLLTGILFGFGVQSRAAEVGTLLALGLRPRQVRRLMLAEGAILAAIGGILGAAAGLLYTVAALWALSTVWSGAVGGSDLLFHADPLTVAGGAAAGIVVALATIWLTVRRQARAPARELMAAGAEAELRLAAARPIRRWIGPALLILGLGGAAAIFVTASGMRGEAVAGMVFAAGALLLIAGLAPAA